MDVLDDHGLPTTITDHHACDACGARAKLYVDVNGTELAYCGHHGTAYFDRLITAGHVIVDLRHTP